MTADASARRSETGRAVNRNSPPAVPVTSSSIMPPYVTDVSQPALVKWKRERQEYEDAIEARCAATGEDKLKALRSIKNSFNRNLLKTLCKLEWGTTTEEISEERIRSELDNIIGSVMNDDIIDIDALFDQVLKMDLREADCKFLKQYLEPAALRDAIDTHHRLIDSSSKTDEQALYKLVKEKALEQEKHNTVANTKGEQSSTGSVKSKPRTGCFHCGKDHWLSQCPDLDEAAKETLLAER
eukprot:jgi/Phyca11/98546/e_gw1.3.920.1